jgi:hypothetical protein
LKLEVAVDPGEPGDHRLAEIRYRYPRLVVHDRKASP